MTKILKLDASARLVDHEVAAYRSLSKLLSQHFLDRWHANNKQVSITCRDLGLEPPGFVSQDWIAAVFTPEERRSPEQQAMLVLSDQLIDEVAEADVILISSPMYNYGMPACLKAWFDQVVRVNKTFSFDLARGDFPLQPIFSGKTLVLLSSCGEFGFGPGGIREHMNHLGPHIRTLGHYLGADAYHEIRIEYQEFGDERHQDSIERAYRETEQLADTLAHRLHVAA